jgi:hypothetical protein
LTLGLAPKFTKRLACYKNNGNENHGFVFWNF